VEDSTQRRPLRSVLRVTSPIDSGKTLEWDAVNQKIPTTPEAEGFAAFSVSGRAGSFEQSWLNGCRYTWWDALLEARTRPQRFSRSQAPCVPDSLDDSP